MSYVYLIHLDEELSEKNHARHYIGWCKSIVHRLEMHQQGYGSRFLEVANERGIKWRLAAYWYGGRELERSLKRQKNAPRICPICNPASEHNFSVPEGFTLEEYAKAVGEDGVPF